MTATNPSPRTFNAAVDTAVALFGAQSGEFRPDAHLERLVRRCADDQAFFDELWTHVRVEAVLYAAAKAVLRGA